MDPERTRIYLARHGEVVNHGVYNGQTDVDITLTGLKQMERLRDLLKDKNLSAVYCSDFRRTQKGAEIIAQPHGLVPRGFPHFREMHFGRWQGLNYQGVMEKYPADIPQWIGNWRLSAFLPGRAWGMYGSARSPSYRSWSSSTAGRNLPWFAMVL